MGRCRRRSLITFRESVSTVAQRSRGAREATALGTATSLVEGTASTVPILFQARRCQSSGRIDLFRQSARCGSATIVWSAGLGVLV